MCSLCRLPVAKTHNFGQILTFLYRPPFTDEGQIRCAIADHGVRLPVKSRLERYILSSCGGEKPKCLPFFVVWHLVMSPIGINLRKLSMGAQLQATSLPLFNDIKIVSVLQRFLAKSCTQILTFKSVTDRQTDRQTKTQRFWPPRWRVKSDPHQT